MSPASWIFVLIGGFAALMIFIWLMKMSLDQKNHKDDWL